MARTCLLSLSVCVYVFVFISFSCYVNTFEQAKPETVDKVCEIVKKQLAVAEGDTVTAESTFQKLGADSLDTVTPNISV